MNWFLIALSAPVLWAATNHIDKYLLTKYIRNSGTGSLIIFSCLFAIIALPLIALFAPHVLGVAPTHIVLLIGVGFLNTLGVLFYLYGLERDEASVVVPLFQFIPVFGFIFGYTLLKETISTTEMVGAALIILGTILLSIKFSNRVQIKMAMVFYMLGSAAFFGLHGALFKMIAIQETFWLAAFWEYAGLLVAGVLFFALIRSYRKQFLRLISQSPLPVLALNIMNETLVLFGNIATAYALTVAPVALVLAVSSFQPLFVFLFGIVLTLLLPKIQKEDISKGSLVHKTAGIALAILGGYLINIA